MSDSAFTNPFRSEFRKSHKATLDSHKSNCAAFGSHHRFKRVNADRSVDVAGAHCKRWTCTRCAPRLRSALVETVAKAVETGGLGQWLHLTLRDDASLTVRNASLRLLRKWRGLRDLYRKRFGRPLPFVWFRHVKNGRPHLHVFTGGLDPAWIKSEWHRRTGAFVVELQELAPGTARYAALYATRPIHGSACEFGNSCGRWYGASRGIRLKIRGRREGGDAGDDGGRWSFAKGPLDLGGVPPESYEVLARDNEGRPVHVRFRAGAEAGGAS